MHFLSLVFITTTALAVAQTEGSVRPISVSIHESRIQGDNYKVRLEGLGSNSIINLRRPIEQSVLGNDFHILNVDTDKNGQTIFNRWSPSAEDLHSANDIYVDENDKGTFKLKYSEGKTYLNGIYDGVGITHDGNQHFATVTTDQRKDYIDLKRNITPFSGIGPHQSGPVDAIVEMVIVCDKEFGDIFNHDNKLIMDYFTVYMWDFNIRYKSLPSDNISFRINGIVVISSINAQPFIEEARASDGRAEFGRILDRYTAWVYEQRNSLPKSDLTPLITNTNLEWGGGLAWMNGACWVDATNGRNLGTAVWNDGGNWGSLTVGVHEIGHNMGAPHDDDPNFPGGCPDRGFIMGGGNDDYRYFFSSCSDRLISTFVRSSAAQCLQSIDGPVNPVIDPSYSNPKAPTMAEHCRRSLNNPNAYIETVDTFNCLTMRCLVPGDNGVIWIYFIPPVENTMCADGAGRCFRGVCRPPTYMFKHVGSGLCMRATNPFAFTAPAELFPCPSDGTPLERFMIGSGNTGDMVISTPFTYDGNKESGNKCLYTGNADGNGITTDRCNGDNPWHSWEFRDVGGDQFLLVHILTGRCAKPTTNTSGSQIQTFTACDNNDNSMRWIKYL